MMTLLVTVFCFSLLFDPEALVLGGAHRGYERTVAARATASWSRVIALT